MPTRRLTGAVVKTSVQLPEALWRRTKIAAANHHRDLRDLIIAALEAYLPRLEKEAGS